jgi:hypothetical protein
MNRYTARADAWYQAAYRRLEAAERYQGAATLPVRFPSNGWNNSVTAALQAIADDFSADHDARAAIAARYSRLASVAR